MSRGPNPGQVAELLGAVQLVREQDATCKRLLKLIEESKKSYELHTQARARNREKVAKLLESMDCAQCGNFGWEGRILELLQMLVETATTAAAERSKS